MILIDSQFNNENVKPIIYIEQPVFNEQSSMNLTNFQTQKVKNKKTISFVGLFCLFCLIISYFYLLKDNLVIQNKDIILNQNQNLYYNQNNKQLVQKYEQNKKKSNTVSLQTHKIQDKLQLLLDEGSKRILMPQQSFCIIIQLNNNQQSLLNQLSRIKKQKYKKWKAIFYVTQNYQILSQKLKHPQTKVLKSLQNIGKNIYNSIINECPQNSIIITLKYDEFLAKQSTLANLYNEVSKGYYHIVVSPIKVQGISRKPNQKIQNFERDKYFKLYQKTADLSLIDQILSHIRVFKSSIYFRVPYMQLMYENQTFIDSELAYILPIFQISFKDHVLVSKTLLYNNHQNSDANQNKSQIIQFIGKKSRFPIQRTILYQVHQIGLRKQPKLWTIDKSLDILKRNISKQVKIIPQIIHQIWIGSEIPNFKKQFMRRFKDIMPEYQYRLWRDQNLTKENFPFTYQYILKLQQIDKTSLYSKQSMIADLMRYQIIYHHGGFYYDTNYEPFKKLQHLRHFPFIGVIQVTAQFGQNLANSFFAAQKNSIYLKRILAKQMLDNIDYYSYKGNVVAATFYLATAFTFEDYYYKVKILTSQIFYPFMPWSHDERRHKSLCSYSQISDIPKQLYGSYQQVIQVEQYYQLFPCKNQYVSGIYGIDHWNLGRSWGKKKNITRIQK